MKKKKFYQDKFQNCGNGINKNWKVLTKLIPKKTKIVNDVKLMIGNDQVPNKQIADVLNKAFNEVGLRLQTPSGNTSEGELNSLQTLSMPTCEFKLCPIKEEYVLKELLSIVDCSKAVGVDGIPDGIHPKLLNLAAAYIAELLIHLFNATLQTSLIPKDFKTARISPIHKGGSFDVNNFRPISVLPALSKILERAIHDQLYSYLNVNKLLANCQSGFRSSYSTATCLTEISDYLFDKMDKRYFLIGGIFLDLRKAFDVIPHNFILKKLMYYGIKGKEYDWMESYLTDRRQFVTVNDCTSECLKIRSGVP